MIYLLLITSIHTYFSFIRIQGFHRYIDGCTEEISKKAGMGIKMKLNFILGDCENRIDDLRARVRTQQETIRTRRSEAATLRQEAERCRREADSNALLGTRERELGQRSKELLEQGI